VFTRRWASYNDPLVEVVLAAADHASRPVHVLDIGAGVGDTAFLVAASAPDQIASLTAVEGNAEFYAYLEGNLPAMNFSTKVWRTYLSRAGEALPGPVRTHAGTAALVGGDRVSSSRRLDDVWQAEGSPPIDVMKIDTDGHDGRVLAGAVVLLTRCRPLVLFEWSPRFLAETNNSPHEAFEVLTTTAYDRFVWFDKYGEFSHISVGHDPGSVAAQLEFCLTSQSLPDWHYDVAALPSEHPVSATEVADLMRARTRKPTGTGRTSGFRFDPRTR